MERLLALWLPGLSLESSTGAELRDFAEALRVVATQCPFVTPVRLGLAVLPARAPSRFFGGEEAVCALLRDELHDIACRNNTEVRIGIADGLFAATRAAKENVVVPYGATPTFLAALPLSSLRRPELAALCVRLGLPTLGHFGALDPDRVLERFGTEGLACHRVARGESGELEGLRDPSIQIRLRALDEPQVLHSQPTFFGGTSLAQERATRAAIRLQQRFGARTVQVARLYAGHDPHERGELVPFGAPTVQDTAEQLWPGGLPAPSPTTVFCTPRSVRLTDKQGTPVGVSPRGLLSTRPERCTIEGEPRTISVRAWAGPWPLTTRWWESRRHRVRLQVLTETGVGMLLAMERGGWFLLGRYD